MDSFDKARLWVVGLVSAAFVVTVSWIGAYHITDRLADPKPCPCKCPADCCKSCPDCKDAGCCGKCKKGN